MKTGRSESTAGVTIRHTLAGVATVLFLLPGSCAPAYNAPPVSAPLLAYSRTPASTLERGYQIHQAACANCHPYEDPAKYDPIDLEEDIMPLMARKAKLDRADEKAVLAYLLAARQLH